MKARKAIAKCMISLGIILAIWFIWAFEDGGWVFEQAFFGEAVSLLFACVGIVWYDGLKDREERKKW